MYAIVLKVDQSNDTCAPIRPRQCASREMGSSIFHQPPHFGSLAAGVRALRARHVDRRSWGRHGVYPLDFNDYRIPNAGIHDVLLVLL
ncbi:unnamed protein product [Mycena citricolor]|uniref:Uncharacterized protein n=1 Tax=Mycena citricolor TaxID=2018698 RepID=A0AAD2K7C2_9AGAR|nr:unnamed protein product [Mycena citricolor]